LFGKRVLGFKFKKPLYKAKSLEPVIIILTNGFYEL